MKKLKKKAKKQSMGKMLDKTRLSAMPKFGRDEKDSPHAKQKAERVSLEQMIKKAVNRDDEARGIY